MIASNKKHIIIDKIKCTLFVSIKKCVFIFAVFKKAIDCIIIDNPLKDNKPVANIMALVDFVIDNVLQPRVTSTKP